MRSNITSTETVVIIVTNFISQYNCVVEEVPKLVTIKAHRNVQWSPG